MIINTRIGVLGGSAQAKLLAQQASKWNLDLWIMDASFDMPGAKVTNQFIEGDITDQEQVYTVGKHVEIITPLNPNVHIPSLIKLEGEGKEIYPQPEVMVRLSGQPTNLFSKFEMAFLPMQSITPGSQILTLIGNRNESNECSFFPILITYSAANPHEIYSTSHHNLSTQIQTDILKVSEKVVQELEIIGTLTLRFVLNTDQKLFGLSIDPYLTHEGSYTLDACSISQYEQHLRAILNLPLGQIRHFHHSFHLTLWSNSESEKEWIISQMPALLTQDKLKIHLYGGNLQDPIIGHLTLLEDDFAKGLERLKELQKILVAGETS